MYIAEIRVRGSDDPRFRHYGGHRWENVLLLGHQTHLMC